MYRYRYKHTSQLLVVIGSQVDRILLLRRKLPMDWGTTTDKVATKINPFQYARETKYLTLKGLDTYLIPDG